MKEKKKINNILFTVAEGVISKLAFMFALEDDEINIQDNGPEIFTMVNFKGPFSGKLIMSVSEKILPEIAANMLGVEENETGIEEQYDAIKELINVICGNLLPEIAGKKTIFKVGTPKIISDGDKAKEELKKIPFGQIKLAFDGGWCGITMYVRGEIPAEHAIPIKD